MLARSSFSPPSRSVTRSPAELPRGCEGAASTGADDSFMFRSVTVARFILVLSALHQQAGLETGDSRQALNSSLVHCRFRDLAAAATSKIRPAELISWVNQVRSPKPGAIMKTSF